MNLNVFFSYIRNAPFGGRLTQAQVDGITVTLESWKTYGSGDKRHLAYVFATEFWETGQKMQPVEENLNYKTAQRIFEVFPRYFQSVDEAARYVNRPRELANRVYGGRLGNDRINDGWTYRGRGKPQLTGRVNYRKFGIEENPEYALDIKYSSYLTIVGMLNGMFTGKGLSDYFNDTIEDAVGARAIVNGTDKASLIAGFYKNFLDAIEAAERECVGEFVTAVAPNVTVAEAAQADDVKPSESKSIMTIVGGMVTGGGVSLMTGINNPWAFLSFIAVLVSGCVLGWLIMSGRIEIKRKPK